jgi:hypothetical protein
MGGHGDDERLAASWADVRDNRIVTGEVARCVAFRSSDGGCGFPSGGMAGGDCLFETFRALAGAKGLR